MMTIKDFYQREFYADPFQLVRAAGNELYSLAQEAGIDWGDCVGALELGADRKFGQYNGKPPTTLKGTPYGRADFYSKLRVVAGLTVPYINFIRKAKPVGNWCGYAFLQKEYEAYLALNGTTVSYSAEEMQRRARLQAEHQAREAEHARKEALKRRIHNQDNHQRLVTHLAFEQAFYAAPKEDGTFPYAVKKAISDVFAHCDVRRMVHLSRGYTRSQPMMAIPLAHLDGRYNNKIVSWQRITADGKFQTRAVEGLEYKGACHVIGNLQNAKRACVVEGFATGASVWLSGKFDAVIVAVSANNMLPVVAQLVHVHEAVKIWCALDNDAGSAQKGKGNAGLLAGLEIMRRYPGVVCTHPIFSDAEVSADLSDFNDLHVAHGLKEVARQISSRENRFKPASELDGQLTQLALMPRNPGNHSDTKKFMKQLMHCVDVGMKSCPVVYSPSELYTLISERVIAMKAGRDGLPNVKSSIKRQFNAKSRKAQAFRSFSSRITDDAERPDHITYKYFGQSHAITPEVLAYIRQLQGPVIVRAGMGSGKSKHLLRPMMHAANRGVSVAHRVSLIGGLWDMMTRDEDKNRIVTDILHYQDEGYREQAPYASKLTICINSIVKGCWQPLMKNHEFFGLDEATQGLRAILSGRAMENPTAVFNQLIDAIARTEDNAVLVDADASDILIDLCELALVRREKLGMRGWTQIHVVELPVDVSYRTTPDAEPQKRRVLYTDKDRVYTEVLKAAAVGEKFLLATDSTMFAEQVMIKLREQWPEKKWLYVSQDTKQEQDATDFTDAPDDQAQLYDGLIYSPAISSGVSIETKHFTRHFGMFCGQIVPSDAIQMLRRDRTATEFMIGLAQLPGYREENADNIHRGIAQAMVETAVTNNEVTDVRIDGDTLCLGLADTPFARMKFKVLAKEAMARNEFSNNLICILFADGYDVEHLAADEEASAAGKEIRKEAKEQHWDLTVARHLAAETPDQQLRDELLQKRSLSADESAQLIRWDIEHELKQEVSEESLKFIRDGGKKKLALAELMRMDDITAAKIDREQALINFTYQFKRDHRMEFVNVLAISQEQANAQFARLQPGVTAENVTTTPLTEASQRAYASLHRKALRQYFETCGINPDTGEGETTQEALQTAMDELIAPERLDMFNNVLRFGGHVSPKAKPKQPSSFFKQICEAVGLEASKRRQRIAGACKWVWSITPTSYAFVDAVLALRAQDGQTFFALKQAQTVKPESDPAFIDYIDTDLKAGSAETPVLTGADALQDAVRDTPVPFAWVRDVLTRVELEQLASMPLKAVRATLAGIYLLENMGLLATGDYEALKQLQAG
ncbi:plasmid replication protein, CyRepA1 family [Nissabacter sp. SGAir0207]|uniref:plasmid replication protein, CyRepA1 family n=1 Tax=Nissabacter sp. SGAir0207 TaxID=2126321 RepID=UPI00143DF93D|nr:plasmid replication protein, CyRepA1 family [Nissabacter sp. SGAir0207]